MPFVYILKSEKGKYYIGSTIDLPKRLKHHYGGYTPSTKSLGKLNLVLSQKYATLKQARYIELRLKKLKRKDYLEKIIKDGLIEITPP